MYFLERKKKLGDKSQGCSKCRGYMSAHRSPSCSSIAEKGRSWQGKHREGSGTVLPVVVLHPCCRPGLAPRGASHHSPANPWEDEQNTEAVWNT